MPSAEIRVCDGYKALHSADLPIPCYYDSKNRIVDDVRYCLLHAPINEKAEAFEKMVQKKRDEEDYNFRGGWFPTGVDFSGADLKDADFSGAVFNKSVSFKGSTFSGSKANFTDAQFKASFTDFIDTHFLAEDVSFTAAIFTLDSTLMNIFTADDFYIYAVNFSGAEFKKGPSFTATKFGGAALFVDTNFNEGCPRFFRAEFSVGTAVFLGTIFGHGADFKSARFIENANFRDAQFIKEIADFTEARFGKDVIFSGAKFPETSADFTEAEFEGRNVYFDYAVFGGPLTKFRKARFAGDVSFENAEFANYLNFNETVFGKHVFFDGAKFSSTTFVDFRLAQFMDLARFLLWNIEPGAQFYFGEAIFDKPDRVYFGFIGNLELSWFLNTDTRKFNYQEVRFPALKNNPDIKRELEKAKKLLVSIDKIDRDIKKIDSRKKTSNLPYAALVTVFRRMAENAEENGHFRYASDDRKFAFETERLERREWRSKKKSLFLRVRDYFSEIPHFLYRWLSSYGENWSWALSVMFAIWIIFAVLYLSPLASFYRWETKVSSPGEYQTAVNEDKIDKDGRNLRPGEAFTYSFAVMALQKPEPKPLGPFTGSIVLIETVFAPIQLALLALAIRRKFMR